MKNEIFNDYIIQIERLRLDAESNEFSHLKNQVYLDFAANSIYPKSLIKEYYEKITNHNESLGTWSLFSNPHSHSQSGIYTNLFVDSTREKVLNLFNTNSNEYDVVFVQNATHGLKLLAESFNFQNESYFAYLNDNHTSVIGLREIVWCQSPKTQVCCVYEKDDSFDVKYIENPFNRTKSSDESNFCGNNLFIMPAQSNFNGRKYDLGLIESVKNNGLNPKLNNNNLFVCLDTASFTSTSFLDLQKYKPDFLVVSFYKIFGYPTGIGALIVRKTHEIKQCLNAKKYFGGGTVSVAVIDDHKICLKNCLVKQNGVHKITQDSFHEFLEDGTLSFMEIIGLSLAIDKFKKLTFNRGVSLIESYVSELTEYCYQKMVELQHYNGQKLVEIYRKSNLGLKYGPIIAFNLKNSSNNYISFNLVNNLAQENRIHLRTGCFCNIGACQMFLNHLDSKNYFDNFEQYGHKCGDHIDLIEGKPTGAIRISFGYASIKKDIDLFVKFLIDNFVENKNLKLVNFEQSKISLEKQFFKIVKLFIYPIKSCRPFPINESWPLKKGSGFFYDRSFVIIDSNGIPLSQKRYPNLTKLQPVIDLKSKRLILKFSDEFFELDLKDDYENIPIVYANKIPGYDQGEEASEWLSRIFRLNEKCRLIRINSSNNDNLGSFANKADFLMISENSVKSVRKFLVDNLEESVLRIVQNYPITKIDDFLLQQFRPNIVVQILDESVENKNFNEEFWGRLKILNKNIGFKIVDNCTRCQMINIDQSSMSDDNNNENIDFSFLCSSLLKQIYKFKSNSKFGIYLSHTDSDSVKRCSEFLKEFHTENLIQIGDIGSAEYKKSEKVDED